MSRFHVIAMTVVAFSALSSAAYAGSSGTTDIACGYAPANWDAPAGSLVSSRGEGPITSIIDAVGETRTHSMISHGTSVSHAVMHTPGQNGWPTYCDLPLKDNELRYGYPGASRTSVAGMYISLYEGSSAPAGYFLQFQNAADACAGLNVSNYLLNTAADYVTASQQNSYQTYYRYTNSAGYMPYSTYQFMNSLSVPTGGSGVDNGVVCSTFAAWSEYKANSATRVTPYTYTHAQLAAGLNALYNSVYSECNNGMGFWTGMGAAASCIATIWYFDTNICDDAARQVANCFAQDRCNSSDNGWENVRNNTYYTATSVSPDRMGGWGARHTNSGSIWASAPSQQVTWSGPNVYSCWF